MPPAKLYNTVSDHEPDDDSNWNTVPSPVPPYTVAPYSELPLSVTDRLGLAPSGSPPKL